MPNKWKRFRTNVRIYDCLLWRLVDWFICEFISSFHRCEAMRKRYVWFSKWERLREKAYANTWTLNAKWHGTVLNDVPRMTCFLILRVCFVYGFCAVSSRYWEMFSEKREKSRDNGKWHRLRYTGKKWQSTKHFSKTNDKYENAQTVCSGSSIIDDLTWSGSTSVRM